MFMICLSLICFSRNRVGGMSYVKDVAAYCFKDSIAAALFMSMREMQSSSGRGSMGN